MRKVMILAAPALAFTSLNALAQTDLKAYATRTVILTCRS